MEQTQKHKKSISEIFNRAADRYGKTGPDFFNYFGERIVKHAELKQNMVVLDVACGRGASMFPASKIVGKVFGIDISSEMIRRTKLDILNPGIDNIELHEMDIENLNFSENMFDAVICGFSLFFLPNLPLALQEINRVLKPKSLFTTSTFGKRDERWTPILEMMGFSTEKLKAMTQSTNKMLNSEKEILANFENSGLKIIEICQEQKEFYYKTREEWWNSIWASGYRGFLERLDEQSLNNFREKSFDFLSSLEDENGIPEIVTVLITKAKKISSN